MRIKGLCEAYVLSELAIKLCDSTGSTVDTAYAMDVGATVEFDYEPGDDIDSPQVKIHAVTAAGAALEGECTTVNFWMGRDLLPYLPSPDVDLIEEEMIKRMNRNISEHNEDMKLHARID